MCADGKVTLFSFLETCTVTLNSNAVSDHPKPVLYFDETCIPHYTGWAGKMRNLV